VLLLVLAGVANTVLLTESTAGRPDATDDEREITALLITSTDAVEELVARTNRASGSYAEKVDRVEQRVGNWSAAAGRTWAVDATGVEAHVVNTTEGVRLTQSTESSLTNATGVANWTLAENISRSRQFQLTVNQSTLPTGDCAAGASCVTVIVDNGTTTWRVAVNRSAVYVNGPAGDGTCPLGADGNIDLTAGTVAGTDCVPLTFADGLSGSYAIRYANGTDAMGTYQLTVDGSPVVSNYDAASDQPSFDAAVYATTVRVDYQRPTVTYATTIRVARGEPDG
jgi:hypothetical protein